MKYVIWSFAVTGAALSLFVGINSLRSIDEFKRNVKAPVAVDLRQGRVEDGESQTGQLADMNAKLKHWEATTKAMLVCGLIALISLPVFGSKGLILGPILIICGIVPYVLCFDLWQLRWSGSLLLAGLLASLTLRPKSPKSPSGQVEFERT